MEIQFDFVLALTVMCLKVQRPGERPENMGLSCLDEPKVKQSDPTLLDLTLRTLSKQTTVKPMVSPLSG